MAQLNDLLVLGRSNLVGGVSTPFLRHGNGDITHPGTSGTIALTTDVDTAEDSAKSYTDTQLTSNLKNYLPLAGGTLSGTLNSSSVINLYGANAYFSLGTSASSSKCYFQTYNATTSGADDANLKAGFGFGWAKSLIIDKSGNVTIPGSLTLGGRVVNDEVQIASSQPSTADLWIDTADSSKPKIKYKNGSAYTEIQAASGVYVGSGTMPSGYNVQIDPTSTADSTVLVTKSEFDALVARVAALESA